MTIIDTTRLSTGGGLMTRLLSIVHTVRAWNDARQTRRALLRLSEHELDDIGLCRGDIDRISRPTYF
ncbi:DUF1127 domain-containing protein [Ponticoccus sp. SC2-23]|uniref:DUF1127 domain-containing protein n=1 Tax=Alexandriicola marinus TaxID=2081710 RepID=UPI000FDC9F32|nr:DUF1127 domain-containing protein [Alexandriicola marinus]MBM1221527.1 DUF1127 domain-containing protein [Ponticoccus sp. SC6-9]MBM1226568.1 DUF1127 domain-containing protein [Ponticoccus sp. SC6-15]MBM1230519.1 DUF1127 domain-containing protein [Ponticoccus sp. SC6-38]MBM1235042.1 DUF1127 domain-containing protein [Ponticoccus sp. SC6-45]MBM1239540.1 DUF1127 domain-containing protein [Ponticoccus sp. SC6-49]MBM1243322.1 DUF1127 domain-containing protein [Ponticoccus sp. SC2-64]MBM1248566